MFDFWSVWFQSPRSFFIDKFVLKTSVSEWTQSVGRVRGFQSGYCSCTHHSFKRGRPENMKGSFCPCPFRSWAVWLLSYLPATGCPPSPPVPFISAQWSPRLKSFLGETFPHLPDSMRTFCHMHSLISSLSQLDLLFCKIISLLSVWPARQCAFRG